MKKNGFAILILIILALLAGYFIYTNTGSTIKEELRDFAVSDTNSVDKIFLADKSGKQCLLERTKSGYWTVNSHSKARPDAISLLLYTMNAMEIRSPVAKAARDNIIKSMSANSIKVEIYLNGVISKTYYVGGSTQDQLGTFMYLEHSTVPFIMHIPGFDGYLTPRFITDESEWKMKSIFLYKQGEIKKLLVQNINQPAESFELTKQQENSYSLATLPEKKMVAYPDTGVIQSYLASYQFINYEKTLKGYSASRIDSIVTKGPFMVINISDINDNQTEVKLYLKPADPNLAQSYDQNNKLLPFDPDRLLAKINNDSTLVVVQYFVFDKLLVTRSYLENPVKKSVK